MPLPIQHLICLYNGEGFVVVNDNLFWALFAQHRRDVTKHDRQGRKFVIEFLKERSVPRIAGQAISVGPILVKRWLGVICRQYAVKVHVVRVDPDYKPKGYWVVGLDQYAQRAEIEPLLAQAIEHYAVSTNMVETNTAVIGAAANAKLPTGVAVG
jgi:hypothetical protein